MNSFAKYAEHFINGEGNWNSLPRMIKDCIRVNLQLRDFKGCNQLKSPIFKVFDGSPYTDKDIVDGLSFLLSLDIHSFIFIEHSTYGLKLLEQFFSVPDRYDLCYSCSSSTAFEKPITDRWGSKSVLHGIVIKITDRKQVVKSESLPTNILD